jgi:hypothetical protein
MTYERSVMGQILGYSEFIVESAGQDQALSRVPFLHRPDRLYIQCAWCGRGRGARVRPPAGQAPQPGGVRRGVRRCS